MPPLLPLSDSLEEGQPARSGDVIAVKGALSRLGWDQSSGDDMDDSPSGQMFQTLGKFQNGNGLDVTNAIDPGDATHATIDQQVS